MRACPGLPRVPAVPGCAGHAWAWGEGSSRLRRPDYLCPLHLHISVQCGLGWGPASSAPSWGHRRGRLLERGRMSRGGGGRHM